MNKISEIKERLAKEQHRWLITGVAGFIGSHLLEQLLLLGQEVIGLDNLSTGKQENLDLVKDAVGKDHWKKFHFIYGDICSPEVCKRAVTGVDYLLHQAALGSVPRSIVNPRDTTKVNVDGFNEIILAAKEAGVKRIAYASSSSVYGNLETPLRKEEELGKVLSPYAASKRANEIYAEAFTAAYGLEIIGLRYFNVFGPRQNPEGEYAAVIPKWLKLLSDGKEATIFGDGKTSRDFCFVDNVVNANLLAVFTAAENCNQAYNVAVGETTTLNELFEIILKNLKNSSLKKELKDKAHYADFRVGDVKSSLADISKIKKHLGYAPAINVQDGLKNVVQDFVNKHC